MKQLFMGLLLFFISMAVQAEINIFACEPEWEALSQELGGDKVTTYSATTGLQDPHYIQARPSLIAKSRRADLLVCTGAELETGWLPLLQRKSGNRAIQNGAPGAFMATDYVQLTGIPSQLDRSQGHIHAAGNPHIQTSPIMLLTVAKALSERLQQLDQNNQAYYQQRWTDFEQRWQAATLRWQQQAESLKGLPIVIQHNNWDYLIDWLGLEKVATLEAKPGVPPTVNDLNNIVKQLKLTPAKVVIHAAYQSPRASRWLTEKTGIAKVALPFTIGGNTSSTDLFKLFDNTIELLLDKSK
ncbi:zinc ABC transporter substrate-binding protein [Methylophaga sp. 42_25_T18]|nr:zinc ABC transporter substrate-binding protein [Methylophaga sp. 42_25_T18]